MSCCHKQVTIESDGDLHGALVSFLELAHNASNISEAVHLRTLHIEECVEVMMQRDGHAEPLESYTSDSKKRNYSSDEVQQPSKKAKKVS